LPDILLHHLLKNTYIIHNISNKIIYYLIGNATQKLTQVPHLYHVTPLPAVAFPQIRSLLTHRFSRNAKQIKKAH